MTGGSAGEGTVVGAFEMRTQSWRSRSPTLSLDADILNADRDSMSHSSGRLVAIERGRLSQGLGIGLPSLPEISCKVDVDARLLFVSS